MTGKLPLIFPFQSLPPLTVSGPSCPCYPAHLPPLPSQSFSPQYFPALSASFSVTLYLFPSSDECHLFLPHYFKKFRSQIFPPSFQTIRLLPWSSCSFLVTLFDTPLCLSLLLLVFISSPVCSSRNQNSNHPQSDLEMQLYLVTWYTLFSIFIIGRLEREFSRLIEIVREWEQYCIFLFSFRSPTPCPCSRLHWLEPLVQYWILAVLMSSLVLLLNFV